MRFRRAHRWWFQMKWKHPRLRSRALRRRLEAADNRMLAAQTYARASGVPLGEAIEALYGNGRN